MSWNLQASAGAVGKSILWRGNWSSALSYNPYDGVSSNGSSYISKTNNTDKIPSSNPADWDVLSQGLDSLRLPKGYLSGMILSNNVTDTANDIDISAGSCRGDADLADIVLPSAITKRLDAVWVAGTNQGGRDTGAIADVTWHVFAIANPSTNVVDVLFSQSISSPTLPSGFTKKRRIGSVIRISGVIQAFQQLGDYFMWMTPAADANGVIFTSNQSILVPLPHVPVGLKLFVDLSVTVLNNQGAISFVVRSPDQTTASGNNIRTPATNVPNSAKFQVWTDANRGVFCHNPDAAGGSNTTLYLSPIGYWDRRGKED